MRIIGFILIVTLTVPNLTLSRRLPAKTSLSGFSGVFNLGLFKSPPFTVYAIMAFINYLGLFTGKHIPTQKLINTLKNFAYLVLTYIDIGARSVGISADFSFYLVTIANASSLIGRMMTGFGMDAFGRRYFLHITP